MSNSEQTSPYPIFDLHCDLLSFLARDPNHSPYDLSVRCAIPQLQQGHTKLQTFALYSQDGPDSHLKGERQIAAFEDLLKKESAIFEVIKNAAQLDQLPHGKKIGAIAAIENASVLCGQSDPLHALFERITKAQKTIGKFLYASLTWNHENRFGGGASTDIGLKPDGKELINFLVEQGIAIDISHTCDRLAEEIFNYVDKQGFKKAHFLASHSNMRSILHHKRNLPDTIAKEIIRRGGIIGLNFIKFEEHSVDLLAKHLEHLVQLGGEKHVCLGADFFHDLELPPEYRRPGGSFFLEFENASTYQAMLSLIKNTISISENIVQGFAWKNLDSYLKANYFPL